MRIKGLQKTTLIDFPDLIACTVFLPGCNFNCGFCYNEQIVNDDPKIGEIPEKEFFEFLEKRKKILEGVVITGGEPTLQKELPEFLEKIKKQGFKIKIDTNGSNPEMLKEIINKKLADYIAMDIKAPLEDYEKACGVKVDLEKIRESIELLKNSKIGFEFRSTLLPKFHSRKSIERMAELAKGAGKFALQQFSPVETLLDKSLENAERFSREDFEEFRKIMEKSVKKVEIRNLN